MAGRLGRLQRQVRVVHAHIVVCGLLQHLREGVHVGEVERPAWPKAAGHDLGPALKVALLCQGTPAREDDVEGAGQFALDVAGIGLHKGGAQAGLGGQLARRLDGVGGGVDTGHLGAEPRPGERLEAAAAVQMKKRLAGHVAELGDLQRV